MKTRDLPLSSVNMEIFSIRKIKKQPEELIEIYLHAVLMPNGEIICLGKSIGFFDKFGKYVYKKDSE